MKASLFLFVFLIGFLLFSFFQNVMVQPVYASPDVAFTEGFEDQTFDLWDDNGEPTVWAIGTYGSGSGGAADPHTGDYDAWATEFAAGGLISDNVSLADASAATYSIWVQGDDLEDNDLIIYFSNGTDYNIIFAWSKLGNSDDVWFEVSGSITSEYWTDDFNIQIYAETGNNENVWVDDVLIEKTVAGNDISKSGSAVLSFSVASYSTWSFNRQGTVTTTFVSGGDREVAFGKETTADISFSTGSEKGVGFLRFASSALTFLVNSIINVTGGAELLYFFGSAVLSFAVDSFGVFNFLRWGSSGLVFVADSLKSADWLLESTSALSFAVDSLRDMELFKMFSSVLSFSAGSERLMSFLRYGSSTLSFVASSIINLLGESALYFFGSVVLSFSSGSAILFSFFREGIVSLSYSVASVGDFARFLFMFGSAALSFSTGVSSLFGFLLFGSAELAFGVNSVVDFSFLARDLAFFGSATLSFVTDSVMYGLDILQRISSAENLSGLAIALAVMAIGISIGLVFGIKRKQ